VREVTRSGALAGHFIIDAACRGSMRQVASFRAFKSRPAPPRPDPSTWPAVLLGERVPVGQLPIRFIKADSFSLSVAGGTMTQGSSLAGGYRISGRSKPVTEEGEHFDSGIRYSIS
jgi:hypothetical protein